MSWVVWTINPSLTIKKFNIFFWISTSLKFSAELCWKMPTVWVHFFEIMEDLTSKSLFEVELCGNHFDCSCGHTEFRHWLNRTKLIHEKLEVSCSSPMEIEGVPVLNYTENVFKCKVWEPLKWSLMGLGLILLTAFIAVPCYKYRWYLSHARVVLSAIIKQAGAVVFEQKCLYDALILYNIESEFDSSWVVDHLFANTEEYGRSDDIQVCDFRIFVYVLFALILRSENNSLHWFMQLECFLDCWDVSSYPNPITLSKTLWLSPICIPYQ